jgi:predicted nuclease with TOPRIM domain
MTDTVPDDYRAKYEDCDEALTDAMKENDRLRRERDEARAECERLRLDLGELRAIAKHSREPHDKVRLDILALLERALDTEGGQG